MKASFNHPNTCPVIDRQLNLLRSEINDALSNILEEVCPLLGKRERNEYVEQQTNSLYETLENVFESVRESNVDMREAAEEQISALLERLQELEKV